MRGKDAAVLLSLLALCVRNAGLGSTQAAFLTSALVSVTVENFGVLSIAEAKAHVRASLAQPA
jgi:hydroxylamine reductase